MMSSRYFMTPIPEPSFLALALDDAARKFAPLKEKVVRSFMPGGLAAGDQIDWTRMNIRYGYMPSEPGREALMVSGQLVGNFILEFIDNRVVYRWEATP